MTAGPASAPASSSSWAGCEVSSGRRGTGRRGRRRAAGARGGVTRMRATRHSAGAVGERRRGPGAERAPPGSRLRPPGVRFRPNPPLGAHAGECMRLATADRLAARRPRTLGRSPLVAHGPTCREGALGWEAPGRSAPGSCGNAATQVSAVAAGRGGRRGPGQSSCRSEFQTLPREESETAGAAARRKECESAAKSPVGPSPLAGPMRMRLALAPVVLFGSILSTAGAECLLSERGPAKVGGGGCPVTFPAPSLRH